jgi:hypothetical protein
MTELSAEPHFCYLHTNGDLIFKRTRPDEGDFVKKVWVLRPMERESAYIILIEASCLGAPMSRILELARQWNCDGADGLVFCERMGFVCETHEGEAGNGFLLWHKDDDDNRSRGEGSSPLLALISYTSQGDFAQRAA